MMMTDTDTPIPLFDYLSILKDVIHDAFGQEVWVLCELQNISYKSGHYYFELCQSGQSGLVASCRGTLWRSYAPSVMGKFEQATGAKPIKGLTVKLKGRATFHPAYGFSFNISDIDPSYTLGEIALAYLELKNRLIDKGLFDLNKRLPAPFDIQKVAVIAPERGAGLGDFQAEADRLARFGVCDFIYHYATFQGDTASLSLRKAIGQALSASPDILVIIRGGGAVTDLTYLNDYELAAMVAESPIPVWVGIGHERDKGILDEIAHTAFDTPSKVIFGIEKYITHRWQDAKNQLDNIIRNSQTLLALQSSYLEKSFERVRFGTKNALQKQKHNTHQYLQDIKKGSFYALHHTKTQTHAALDQHKIAYHHIAHARQNITHWRDGIMSYHPQSVLNRGYALLKQHQKIITSVNDVQVGEAVIHLKDGKIITNVPKI